MGPDLGTTADGRPARVLALFGPTGVGKTAVAHAIAQRLGADRTSLVSADALQVYRGLETLTGAADLPGLQLTSFVEVTEPHAAGEHAALAHARIDEALATGRAPVVVGGTGLYLRAALADLDLRPPPPPGLRERLEAEPSAALHATLPPEHRDRIDVRDRSRVVRAAELHAMGELKADRGELWTSRTRHPTRLVGLTTDRDVLRERIAARVHQMVADGAREEVLRAHEAGAGRTARAALGFQELLEGDADKMVTRTWQYARRQLTWMRKLPGVELVDTTGRTADELAAHLLP